MDALASKAMAHQLSGEDNTSTLICSLDKAPPLRPLDVGLGTHAVDDDPRIPIVTEALQSRILYPASCILHPVSCILYPASCTLYPTPIPYSGSRLYVRLVITQRPPRRAKVQRSPATAVSAPIWVVVVTTAVSPVIFISTMG